jgi:signal transduction histidine kinase
MKNQVSTLIATLITFWSTNLFGQVHTNPTIDSIFRQSEYYGTNQIDSCRILGDSLFSRATKSNDPKVYTLAYLCYSRYYDRVGDYASAAENAFKGLQVLDDAKDSSPLLRFKLIIQLGICHRLIGLPEIGREFLMEGLQIQKSNNFQDNDINLLYSHLANTYIDFNKYDSVLFYCNLIKDTIPAINNTNMLSGYYNARGKIYAFSGNFRDAILCHQKTISFCNRLNNRFFSASANQLLSALYLQKGFIDSAIYHATLANTLANTYNYKRHLNSSAKVLVSAYEKLGLADSALKYLKIQSNAYELLYGKEKVTLLLEMNAGIKLREKDAALQLQKVTSKNRITLIASFLMLAAFALSFVIYRGHQRKKMNQLLASQNKEIDDKNKELKQTITQLKSTQSQLIQSEKMASLGELTAGIAHEIQNPLNFVNNFSEVSKELMEEMKEELAVGSVQSAVEIADDISQNLEKINHHGKRADAIVKGMLAHSRSSTGQKEPTDINALCEEYLRLAYHGLKAKDNSFEASFRFEPDTTLPKINVVPQDIGRVLLNLINNAFQAVGERVKGETADVKNGTGTISPFTFHFSPLVTVTTKKSDDSIEICVKDNGPGIPDAIKDKIFQPFFTTKPTGQGTGLGLSLSYDIVKAHGGELKVKTGEGEGSSFIVKLPLA